jgi:hypothetical protein
MLFVINLSSLALDGIYATDLPRAEVFDFFNFMVKSGSAAEYSGSYATLLVICESFWLLRLSLDIV